MPTLVLKNNPASGSPVDLSDLGISIAVSGSITFTNYDDIASAAESRILRTLSTDAAYGSSSTVVLNDGTSDIPQADALNFLDTIAYPYTGNYSFVQRGGTGRITDARFGNTDLRVYDTDDSHYVVLKPGSNITSNRTWTLTVGDADKTLDFTGSQGSLFYVDASGNVVALGPGTSGYYLKTFGGGANPAWAPPPGGSAGDTTTVDFGSDAKGSRLAEVVVTGQTSITATSRVRAWIAAIATADHNVAEHVIIPFQVTIRDIVVGTGFTIQVVSDWHLNGEFTVQWEWV